MLCFINYITHIKYHRLDIGFVHLIYDHIQKTFSSHRETQVIQNRSS